MICIIKFGKEIFITSGEIGTHAMHPPGTRIIDINKWQNRIESTGGRGSPPLRGDFASATQAVVVTTPPPRHRITSYGLQNEQACKPRRSAAPRVLGILVRETPLQPSK